MPIAELRAHVTHAYAEFYNECGYCWLEGEANAGEYGGGGYDYYVPSHEAALGCAVPGCVTDHEGLHHTRRGEYAPEPLIGIEHPADGTMSPVVSEPAYQNPFALVGSIGGFTRDVGSARDFVFHDDTARIRRQIWLDSCIAMQVHRPLDHIIISGIS
jgi:hypothetical protein